MVALSLVGWLDIHGMSRITLQRWENEVEPGVWAPVPGYCYYGCCTCSSIFLIVTCFRPSPCGVNAQEWNRSRLGSPVLADDSLENLVSRRPPPSCVLGCSLGGLELARGFAERAPKDPGPF